MDWAFALLYRRSYRVPVVANYKAKGYDDADDDGQRNQPFRYVQKQAAVPHNTGASAALVTVLIASHDISPQEQ